MYLLESVAVYVTHTGVLFVARDLKIVVKRCVLFEPETYYACIWCVAAAQNRRNMLYSFWHGEFSLRGVVAKCNIGNIDTFINGTVCNYLYSKYAIVQRVLPNPNRKAV